MSEGASKFFSISDECVQASNDKVIGLVWKDNFGNELAVISWTKGASSITVIEEFRVWAGIAGHKDKKSSQDWLNIK